MPQGVANETTRGSALSDLSRGHHPYLKGQYSLKEATRSLILNQLTGHVHDSYLRICSLLGSSMEE